jgi:hypothetical protein
MRLVRWSTNPGLGTPWRLPASTVLSAPPLLEAAEEKRLARMNKDGAKVETPKTWMLETQRPHSSAE